jgi:DNA-binding CsgD family transcriptional regulator
MALTSRDLDRALDVLQMVGEAETRDEFTSLSVEGTMDLVPCMIVSANEVDRSAGRIAFWTTPEDFPYPANAQQILAELVGENPLLRHIEETGDGSARRFSDLITREELHNTRLYQEFYRLIGLEYQMSVTLPAPAPKVFVLGDSDKDFTDADCQIMNRIRPHLSQKWRSVRDAERMRATAEMSEDVAAAQGWGAVMLSDPPDEMIPNSFVTLYRHFGRPSRVSPFPGRVDRWLSEQRSRSIGLNEGSLYRPLSARVAQSRVVLRYLPPGRTRPDAIIIDAPTTAGPADLEALGLTGREAEVVRLVMAGVANKEIAQRLQMASGTVRKHLDNVYAKLGVHSRGALTAFILDISGKS